MHDHAIIRAEACNFIKNETLGQVFSCEFCSVSENTFSHTTASLATSVWVLIVQL